MNWLPRAVASRERGAALIIVLAFAVLLTGLTLAYFSRATSDRQVAHSSFHQSSADNLAQSAMDTIIGQLRQEIVNGSTATTVNGSTIIYVPAPAANVVPRSSGNPDPAQIPNLIRRSVSPDNIIPPGLPSLASAVNSRMDVSANGRFVPPARWNAHYLVPKQNLGTDDSIPVDVFANSTPDWVFVTDQGATVITFQNSSVIGRYAYAVYDEGGLLDVNLAGYPTGTTTAQAGRKGSLAYADLGALSYPILNPNASGVYQVDRLVGWRNYATTQPSNKFPDSAPPGQAFARNFQTSSVPATNFFNFVVDPTNSFLMVRSDAIFNNRTDQMFLSRQELIAFRTTTQFPSNALQHLGTFSRDQNMPTWLPSPLPATSLLARFPFAKFAVVSQTPPISGNTAEIKTYFGLQWSSTNSRWQYVEGGSTPVSTISPVDTGQANFFQVLNYLLPGNTIGNILSLGACVIDQYDSDSTTTLIEYGSGIPIPVTYGMEAPGSPRPPGAPPPPTGYVVLNRPFRNVGELGYAFSPITGSKLNFHAAPSSYADAKLLDFFTVNTATPRSGFLNLNTRNPYVLAAVLNRAITTEPSSIVNNAADATTAANSIVAETANAPALGRADVARLASVVTNTPFTTNNETRETIARALAEIGQVRTWGLLIDVIAQSGRFPPNAASFRNGFVVEGEQHYWVHVAIDRFTGQVIDKQIEVVNE